MISSRELYIATFRLTKEQENTLREITSAYNRSFRKHLTAREIFETIIYVGSDSLVNDLLEFWTKVYVEGDVDDEKRKP